MQLTRFPLPPNIHTADVAELQRALRQLNFNIADPDGFFGRTTAQAVKAFQRDQQMEQTGMVDRNFSEEAAGQMTLEHADYLFSTTRGAKVTEALERRGL